MIGLLVVLFVPLLLAICLASAAFSAYHACSRSESREPSTTSWGVLERSR